MSIEGTPRTIEEAIQKGFLKLGVMIAIDDPMIESIRMSLQDYQAQEFTTAALLFENDEYEKEVQNFIMALFWKMFPKKNANEHKLKDLLNEAL